MRYFQSSLLLVLIVSVLLVSCGRSDSPISPSPDLPAIQHSESSDSGHHLLSYYIISVDFAQDKIELIPLRQVADHWNILGFLENGPCTTCVNITNFQTDADGSKLVDIQLIHPFPGTNFTGFDVRGIVMFDGTRFFTESGLTVSDSSLGDGECLNADGYTTLYNPFTWGSGPGGLQGYIPGKFSTPTLPSATLNGYLRHSTEDFTNTRNAFYAADSVTRTYRLRFPTGSIFTLGYAVDASWAPPTNFPVTDPMTDFPPEANCPEPWKIEVTGPLPESHTTINGGFANFQLDVYDYQGSESHGIPIAECEDLFDGIVEAELMGQFDGYSSWLITLPDTKLADEGIYRCLISVEDNENAGSPEYLNLTSYAMVNVTIGPGSWARTWGGTDFDMAQSVAVDSEGNVYITGFFRGTVDFDPGEGVEEHTVTGWSGYEDAFLSKFDTDGDFLWVRTWGGEWHEGGEDVAVDSEGNIYIAGYFNEEVDFDPGPGTDIHNGNGDWDSFLSKFSPDGTFQWAGTWGAPYADKALGVACTDTDYIFVCGYMNGACDFDPGPGVDYVDAIPTSGYLSKFEPNGNYIFSKIWHGYGEGTCIARAVDVDNMGNVYVTGEFWDNVDLDPDSGTQNFTAPGYYSNAYLSSFDSTLNFQWGYGWGGDSSDSSFDVAADDLGSVYAVGCFGDTVDFMPGPGQELWTAQTELDSFAVRYSNTGEFVWSKAWGGPNGVGDDADKAYAVDCDYEGNVYIAGYFNNTMDFDPGPGDYNLTAAGQTDCYLTSLDTNGDHRWTTVVGGANRDSPWGIAVDADRNSYMVGMFQEEVDFNPSALTDNHTAVQGLDCFLVKYFWWGGW